jgi:hypothetical protein
MNTHSPQNPGERHLLAYDGESSPWLPPPHSPDVAWDVNSSRASLVTGIGKLENVRLAYFGADTDASPAVDAEVIVTNEERTVLADRQLLVY